MKYLLAEDIGKSEKTRLPAGIRLTDYVEGTVPPKVPPSAPGGGLLVGMQALGFIVLCLAIILFICVGAYFFIADLAGALSSAPPWVGAVFVLWLIFRDKKA